MCPMHLGVKAVFAKSLERIHTAGKAQDYATQPGPIQLVLDEPDKSIAYQFRVYNQFGWTLLHILLPVGLVSLNADIL